MRSGLVTIFVLLSSLQTLASVEPRTPWPPFQDNGCVGPLRSLSVHNRANLRLPSGAWVSRHFTTYDAQSIVQTLSLVETSLRLETNPDWKLLIKEMNRRLEVSDQWELHEEDIKPGSTQKDALLNQTPLPFEPFQAEWASGLKLGNPVPLNSPPDILLGRLRWPTTKLLEQNDAPMRIRVIFTNIEKGKYSLDLIIEKKVEN